MKVYTKTGDEGETSLLSGGRVRKDDLRIEAYGTVDELNAVLGLLLTEDLPESVSAPVLQCQRSLFAIGAALADPEARVEHSNAAWDPTPIEQWIDAMDSELESLRAFILPGGCRAAALSHVARTVCRRAERRVLALSDRDGGLPEGVVSYLNRMSDALFVSARYLNLGAGISDPEWHSETAE
jgi:cob(I)alamin adenosyltransferase